MNCTYDDKGTGACKQGESRNACGREGGTSNTHNKKKIYSEAQTARKYGRIRHKEKGKAEERELYVLRLTFENKSEKKKERQNDIEKPDRG